MTDTPPRIIAVAANYSEVIEGYRRRKGEVGATFEALDHRTGLPAGYTSKLMMSEPMKVFGPLSLPLVNEALGVRLALIEVEPAEQVAKRHDYRTLRDVGRPVRPRAA